MEEALLRAKIEEILYPQNGDLDSLEIKVDELAEELKSPGLVYQKLFLLLSSFRFSEKEAECYWDSLKTHRKKLSELLGRQVSLRVALIDYFTSETDIIDSPLLVELNLFQGWQYGSMTDELTGVYNQRFFREYLWKEFRRSVRYKKPFALVMIDIDDFNDLNRAYSELAGDEILKACSSAIEKNIRIEDIVVRYFSDKFFVLLTQSDRQGSKVFGSRIQSTLEKMTVNYRGSEIRFTVSIGAANFPDDSEDPVELLSFAEKALYHAKFLGKDQVVCYGEKGQA